MRGRYRVASRDDGGRELCASEMGNGRGWTSGRRGPPSSESPSETSDRHRTVIGKERTRPQRPTCTRCRQTHRSSHQGLISASTRCSRPTARSGSGSGWPSTYDQKSLQTRSTSRRGPGAAVHRGHRLLQQLRELVPPRTTRRTKAHKASGWITPITVATVLALLALGWAIARDIGRVAGPTFFRRMDPGTAGTVGFLVRLVTVGITLLVALEIAGVSAASLVAATSAFTAVILGLAAQQTLGNLFAGMVLLSARPFRVGERVRLQAGAVGGTDRRRSSARSACSTRRWRRARTGSWCPTTSCCRPSWSRSGSPTPVDVKVRLAPGSARARSRRSSTTRSKTPTRGTAAVLLEELDGDDVVVRVQATPDRPDDGARWPTRSSTRWRP